MTARGPERESWNPATDTVLPWEYDHDDIGYDDVPFSFTTDTTDTTDMASAGYIDSGDYTYDCRTSYQTRHDAYNELAGKINSLAARVAELERTIERWSADS